MHFRLFDNKAVTADDAWVIYDPVRAHRLGRPAIPANAEPGIPRRHRPQRVKFIVKEVVRFPAGVAAPARVSQSKDLTDADDCGIIKNSPASHRPNDSDWPGSQE